MRRGLRHYGSLLDDTDTLKWDDSEVELSMICHQRIPKSYEQARSVALQTHKGTGYSPCSMSRQLVLQLSTECHPRRDMYTEAGIAVRVILESH